MIRLSIICVLFVSIMAVRGEAGQTVAYPLDNISAANRAIVAKALKVIERECPALAKIEWSKLNQPKAIPSGVTVTKAAKSWAPEYPFRKPFAWPAEVGVFIDRGPGTAPISLTIGAGNRPGISSRTEGGYLGAKECGLDRRFGEYTFRDVPELGVLNELR